MANNRMWLCNRRTGQKILVAKYYPSTGWFAKSDLTERLNSAFETVDFGHLAPEQREANAQHLGLGVPFPSRGGKFGEEWVLEYEQDCDPPQK